MPSLKAIIRRVYHAIPLSIRHGCTSFLWETSHRLKRFLNAFYPEIFVFHGTEKHSQEVIRVAYAGSSSAQKYWIQAVFKPGFVRHALGRQLFWKIRRTLEERSLKCDLFLAEHNRWTLAYFSRKPGFRIPHWVDMEIDISGPLEKLFGKRAVSAQKAIEKNRLNFEFTSEPRHFNDFYHNMYLPYTLNRYANIAEIATYPALEKIFSRGEILFIKNEQTVLCGDLIEINGKEARCRKLGIRDGNWKHVREGVIGACYYFTILEMKRRGCQTIHLGGTRPFLSDGLTQFKISFKAQVTRNKNSCLWLALLNDSPGLRQFLTRNPFLSFERDDKPETVLFFRNSDTYTDEELNKIFKENFCRGLTACRVFVFGDLKAFKDRVRWLNGSFYSFVEADVLFDKPKEEHYENSRDHRRMEPIFGRHGKPGQIRPRRLFVGP